MTPRRGVTLGAGRTTPSTLVLACGESGKRAAVTDRARGMT
jgi:hypothetical protein